MYASLFDKVQRKDFAEDSGVLLRRAKSEIDENSIEDLAELIVTLDPYTTGFLQDLKLVVRLSID